MSESSVPYGYCQCGCGEKTAPFRYGCKRDGTKAGEPRKYVAGHKRHHSEKAKNNMSKALKVLVHGEYVGKKATAEYSAWFNMMRRCYNPRRTDFKYYGACGIGVCERWRASFPDFRTDMGECPKGMQLDRRDNDKGYTPENCRWATRTEQQNNKRNNVHVEWKGLQVTVTDLARIVGIKSSRLRQRLKKGWPVEKAVTQPFMVCGRYATKC